MAGGCPLSEIRLDPDTFSLGFTDPSNNARVAKSTTIGLNWYLDSSLRLSVNYAHTDLTGAIPSYIGVRRENGLMFRLQMTVLITGHPRRLYRKTHDLSCRLSLISCYSLTLNSVNSHAQPI
ncbi:MAG: hypothetical protein ABW047_07810 [Nitrospiraceae bacterium]